MPVAAGIGLSFKMRGQDRVVICPFGDGATSRGDWHEGTNMAAVFKCPVVYLCNNNQYAYSTPLERQMAVENVADRAPAYGIPGEIVDGNDVLAVWDASNAPSNGMRRRRPDAHRMQNVSHDRPFGARRRRLRAGRIV